MTQKNITLMSVICVWLKNKYLILYVIFLHFSSVTFAQENTMSDDDNWIDTDRPDNTDSPDILKKGNVQFEGGFLYKSRTMKNVRQTEFLYPRVLARIGVFKFMELRIAGDHRREEYIYLSGDKENVRTSGLNAFTTGTKLRIYEGREMIPSIALVANITLPFFSTFAPLKVAPSLRLAVSHDLTETLTLQYNTGWERSWEEGEVQSQFLFTMVLEKEFNKRIIVFAEGFAEKPMEESISFTIDAGIMYRIRRNLIIDIWGGKPLSSDGPDFFIGSGIGFRLPR